jgi:hypothetical protein
MLHDTRSGAVIDPTGKYRYLLWRAWGLLWPRCLFIMCNPSVADAERDDPTIRRCIGFAKKWGMHGIEVVNLFAYRATEPDKLLQVDDPVGPQNDAHLIGATARAGLVVAAWGWHGTHRGRDGEVARLLAWSHLQCLGKTKNGHPRHPLYVRADAVLERFA